MPFKIRDMRKGLLCKISRRIINAMLLLLREILQSLKNVSSLNNERDVASSA